MKLVDKYPAPKSVRPFTLQLCAAILGGLTVEKANRAKTIIESGLPQRGLEEKDSKSDENAYRWAHLRMKQEREHVEAIRVRLLGHAVGESEKATAARVLVGVCNFMIAHLNEAYARCVGGKRQIDSSSTEPLPDIDLEDASPDTTTNDPFYDGIT